MCERPRTRSHPNTWLKAYWGVNIRASNSLIKHRYNSSTWVSATSAICSQSHRLLLLLLLQTWLQRCTLIVCIGVNVDGLGRRVSQIPPIYYLTDTPTGKLPVFNFYSFIWSRHTQKYRFSGYVYCSLNHVPVLLISSDWLIAVSNVGATVVGKT